MCIGWVTVRVCAGRARCSVGFEDVFVYRFVVVLARWNRWRSTGEWDK